MRWLSYCWRVIVNLFYIAVVFSVLGTIREASQKEIIAVLGLIYTTMRSIAIGQAMSFLNTVHIMDKKIDHIQYQVDSSFEKPSYEETDDLISFTHKKLYIDMASLSIISRACLYAFFSAR